MIYSKTAEYAIRALTVMGAIPEGTYLQVRQIAQIEPISPSFLSKIMRDLTRSRILKSVRGPTGGFTLAKNPDQIRLWDIIEVIDGVDSFDRCLLGLEECKDENPCAMHDSFKPVRMRVIEYLKLKTVAQLSSGYLEKHADRVEKILRMTTEELI